MLLKHLCALYLDQGLDTVWKFAEKVIFPYVEDDELVGGRL